MLYKGAPPDVKKTSWFSGDYDNATNLWDLGSQEGETGNFTYFQKFSWEMNLKLESLLPGALVDAKVRLQNVLYDIFMLYHN